MRIDTPSVEGVLIVANVAIALIVGGVYLTRDDGASAAVASDASSSLQDGPPVLVVVAGDSPTDAAVGGPVAEALGGALLAVPATGLTEAMTTEMSQSEPGRVLILGGPAAVTEATASALRQYTSGPVTRLFGADRFTTAAKVATSQFSSPVRKVRILTGDAAAEPATARDQEGSATPVLLVERDSIPAGVAAALAQMRPQGIEVMGGPSAVSEAVLQQLLPYAAGRVVRVGAEPSDEA